MSKKTHIDQIVLIGDSLTQVRDQQYLRSRMELIDFGYSLLWEKEGLQLNSPTNFSVNCKSRPVLLSLL